jgi:branched-chain amino acid transport system permease protein
MPQLSSSRALAARRFAAAATPFWGPAALVAIVGLTINRSAPYSWLSPTQAMLINLVVVLGLFVFVGNSGIVSFGHMGFMAVGAYSCALMTIPPTQKRVLFPHFPRAMKFILDLDVPPLLAVLISGFVAATLSAVVGYPLMRLSGLAAGMGTFSILVIFNNVISNWTSVTGGASTLVGAPNYATIPHLVVAAVIALAITFGYARSNSAVRLRASREDVNAASVLGINVTKERWISFVLSAFLVGGAGGLYALYLPFSPADFYVNATIFALAMLLVGGSASLWGAVLGTLFLSLVHQVFSEAEAGLQIGTLNVKAPGGMTEIVVALVMLLTLIVRPRGLSGGRELDLRSAATAARWLGSRLRRARPLDSGTGSPDDEVRSIPAPADDGAAR